MTHADRRVPRIAVLGSLVQDIVARVPRHPQPGETIEATDLGFFLGGKGFNQAVAAARLGAAVAMLGMLGEDAYAPGFEQALDLEGIGRAGVRRGGPGTGIALPVVAANGENTIVVAPRSNLALTAGHIRESASLIQGAGILLLQMESSIDASLEAVALARVAGVPVLLNAAPAGVLTEPDHQGDVRRLVESASVVVVNEHEALALSGVFPRDPDSIEAAFRRLGCAFGSRTYVITLGAGGSVLWEGEDLIWAAPFPVTVLDTTGAGDAFVAAFGVRLASGGTAAGSLRFANAAGALAATVLGASPSMPRRDAVEALADGLG